MKLDGTAPPKSRPLRFAPHAEVLTLFARALSARDGVAGAHCVHELWMRGEMAVNIEAMLQRLWQHGRESIPDWLPMRHVEWLSRAYEIAGRFSATAKGKSNVYLVLLDYSDSRSEPYGIYVGMTHYAPAVRFDQHKAGLRAAGSVLKRGLEVLVGPTLHLQKIKRADALRIEVDLAEALRGQGLFVQGGH